MDAQLVSTVCRQLFILSLFYQSENQSIRRFDIALVYKCSKQHTGIDGQLPWQQLVYKKQNICIIKKMKARFELSTYRLHNEICTQQFNVDV